MGARRFFVARAKAPTRTVYRRLCSDKAFGRKQSGVVAPTIACETGEPRSRIADNPRATGSFVHATASWYATPRGVSIQAQQGATRVYQIDRQS